MRPSTPFASAAFVRGCICLATALAINSVCGAQQTIPFPPASLEFFEKEVRPLLVKRCYSCHGPEKAEGDLRADSRPALLTGGSRGPAAIPGDVAKSLLIAAIRYDLEDLKMPPAGRLPDGERATLERWVEMQLPWPADETASAARRVNWDEAAIASARTSHWAFQPPRLTTPPKIQQRDQASSPIDAFLAARWEQRQLTPASAADRVTLLRRVTFDLTGLPPTPDEVESYLSDASPDAWERVIDRLLASPHYGERWGRFWLDIARYADSSGKDENHACANAFRYRDYVVNSINIDRPYNHFVAQQLAGDLLPATSDDERFAGIVATGFLQMGPKALAEQDKQKLLIDIADEQLDTIGRGLIGLTLSCARCHDHKFDPIGTSDYYALAGIFTSTKSMQDLAFVSNWLERPLATADALAQIAAHARKQAEHKTVLDTHVRDATTRTIAGWRSQWSLTLLTAARLSKETPPVAVSLRETTSRTTNQASGSEPRSTTPPAGTRPQADPARITAAAREQNISEYLLARTLSRMLAASKDDQDPLSLFARFSESADAANSQSRNRETLQQWLAAAKTRPEAQHLASRLQEPPPETLEHLAHRFDQVVAGIDQLWSEAQQPRAGQPMPDRLSDPKLEAARQWVYGPKGLLAAAEKPVEHFLPADRQKLTELEAIRDQLAKTQPAAPPSAMAVEEGTVADLRIHLRGNHLNPAAAVARGFPRLIQLASPPVIAKAQSGRAELADWITRPDHPLLSRVLVNRIWQWRFGQGLCRSSDNFGVRGEAPDQPELLDWLAVNFVRDGWSLKQLHRRMLTTTTYQRSSHASRELAEADPDNRWVGRWQRRRLTAEEIRDSLLAVSGQLDLKLGGSVYNYANREPHVTYYKGPVHYDFPRRTLYLPVVRAAMLDVLELFDHGAALSTQTKRDETTVAPQALYFLNSPLVMQASQALAIRLEQIAPTDESMRIRQAYPLLFAREATAEDLTRDTAYLDRLGTLFPEASPVERKRRALQVLCHSWLASNEFVYVE
ncbi:MAG: PSD1 and planctomycete cytochrome C domain-containing protein [Pirellulales bacterium]